MRMTPLPGQLEFNPPLMAWRLDAAEHAPSWDSGAGSERFGGRWNSRGIPVVYCSLDPSTAILEVAVHKGFEILDSKPFVVTAMRILVPEEVRVVQPGEVPNPGWLHAGHVSAGQQTWGDALLAGHAFVALPSVVSKQSWNLLFRPDLASGKYETLEQTRVAIDGRLNPPRP